ncbi:MAG: ribosome maturation factor RimP [Clostridia bacterium]|nr:ribosome maturation factor RimP [Clostridia bacterium]MDD4386674.1 ribosome maturation factor RimP [Clostridia bacterium]
MSNITNKGINEIEIAIENDLTDLGFIVEYIEYVKELDNYILKIVVDKMNGKVDIEDCANISRKIEEKIDDLMKDDKEYVLEVSSAGMERQLKSLKLYKKYIGYDIFVRLFKKTNILKDVNLKEFEAKLINLDEEQNKITVKKNISNIDVTFNLDIKDIASAHTVFDYDKMFKDNKK